MKKNDPKQRHRRWPLLKKMLIIMKLTTVLIFMALFQLSAKTYSQETKLNLKFENETLENVFSKIEANSEFSIFYKNELIKNSKEVTGEFKDALIFKILDQVLKSENLSYTIKDKLIMIVPSDYTTNENNTQQHGKKVTGKVTDSNGSSLPGVSVVVKGTTTGIITDANGNYSLSNIPENATLQFSFVGMKMQEIKVGTQNSINVVMEDETIGLEEVVAIGYGTQKKVNLVGAVSSVKIDEKISSRSLSNVSSGLSGLVPGLTVQQNSGMAGKNEATLIIRGMGTVNNTSPLIVVDGMPDVDINRINMNDIESISVLKDAASASIYGSRAANGVILITTKTGAQNQKAKISYTGTYAVSQPTNFYKFLDDYPRALTLHMRASDNGQSSQIYRQGTVDEWLGKGLVDPFRYPNTDQWGMIFQNGAIQTHSLSASGKTDKMNFYLSAGIMDEKGILINNDFSRYNFRFNIDYNISSNIKIGARMDGQWSKMLFSYEDGVVANLSSNYNLQYSIAGLLPQDPITGRYGGIMAYGEDAAANSPFANASYNHNLRDRQEYNGNLYGEWTPIKGLTARIDYGLRYYSQFTKTYQMPTDYWNFQTEQIAVTTVASSAGVTDRVTQGYKTLLQGRITYDTDLFSGHHLTALAGMTEEYWFARNLTGNRTDRIHPFLTELDATLPTFQTTGGNSSGEGLRSFIGRVNFSINNKYLLEVNARYDGSSKFLPGYQFGFFPSFAAGWRFTEEQFFSGSSLKNIINSGKLRFSLGKLGNNSGVNRYEQRETLQLTNYILNGKVVKGFSANSLINPDFTWEETNATNIGLDLTFMKGRLSSSIDLYSRLTSGMIRPSQLSTLMSGYTAPRMNIGDLQNRGVELTVGWQSKVGDFQYGTNFNISYNSNKLLTWNEFLGKGYTFLDLPYHYVYTSEIYGIAQSWEDIQNAPYQNARYMSPGDIVYKDLNGDGQFNGEDKKASPVYNRDYFPIQGGLSLFFAYKGFDFNVLIQGAALRKDYWLEPLNIVNVPSSRFAFQSYHWTDTWNLDNRSGSMPRIVAGSGGNNQAESQFWLDDHSYLRLKNLQFGYNLPSTMLRHAGVDRIRVYFSSENLLTLSGFRGVDPEKSAAYDDPFPLLSSYTFGVNVDF